MKKLFYILLFVLSFLFYWGTGSGIENRTEAEDVFEYALMVEQGADHPWFYHQHHLLYGSCMRGIYRGASALGYDGRAIDLMRMVSALCAAGTLFFFFLFCYKRFSLRPVSSLISTLFLGVMYGFWRYSAESEIPMIASFLISTALYFATDEDGKKESFALAVFLSVLSVSLHIMNVVAVFAAIPCFYLVRKRWKAMLLHVVICGALLLALYGAVSCFVDVHRSGGTRLSMVGLGAVFKGWVAFVECVISCDFMMGFRSVRAFLGELFAGRMLLEEFYFGAKLSRLHVLFSSLTFLLFFSLLLSCIGRACWVWKTMIAQRQKFQLPRGLWALTSPFVFFFGYGILLLFIEPGNPELWVMGLIPFALLFCGVVLLPLTFDNRLWLPFLMVLVLFAHNASAMWMLHDSDKDYQRQKASAILEIAGPEDIIITAGNPVFERYLRYHFEGRVWYLHVWDARRLEDAQLSETAGNVYVLGDVFNQPRSLKVRFPVKTAEIKIFADQIKTQAELVQDDPFGGVYRLQPVNGD